MQEHRFPFPQQKEKRTNKEKILAERSGRFMKYKKQLIAAVLIGFSLLTGYLILYAFFHREKGDLIFIIFNSYALLSIVLGVVMA
jgi:hypothetical protein